MSNKIIRTVCYFKKDPSEKDIYRIGEISKKLLDTGYEIQTKRICSPSIKAVLRLDDSFAKDSYRFSVGSLSREAIRTNLQKLSISKEISFNLDLTTGDISPDEVKTLFDLISNNPGKTFNFAYVFNNPKSTPFFPSGTYSEDGFSIGLQPTDLAEGCETLDDWLEKMKNVWEEISRLFVNEKDFLGTDSSIAPLFHGKSSFINFVKKLGFTFEKSTTTDLYVKVTNFIKTQNPKPVGLCGLMLPCLEDFELADEYEKGSFTIERNLFLSLQSGLGIDTYPIGVDENPSRVLEILKLVQKLSNKHHKPLSCRFVSDGKTKVGGKTDFQNQYLKDVVVRAL